MFDDDEDDGDNQVDVFGRDDDYGGGFEDQRTNQDEMDQLLQPCLDYDDNDEENSVGLLKPKLGNKADKDEEEEEEEPEQYNIEKYFSNGDVNHTDRIQAVFSKRHGKSGKPRRYGDDDDEDEDDNYGGRRGQQANSDSDDDELDRGGDPLSLEELDGWMN